MHKGRLAWSGIAVFFFAVLFVMLRLMGQTGELSLVLVFAALAAATAVPAIIFALWEGWRRGRNGRF